MVSSSRPEEDNLIDLAEKGDALLVEKLLADGQCSDASKLNQALILATGQGHGSVVTSLLRAGAAADSVNGDDDSALIIASREGYDDIVRTLMASGVLLTAQNRARSNALYEAASSGHTTVVEALMANRGRPWSVAQKNMALYYAAKNGRVNVVELFLRGGCSRSANNEPTSLVDNLDEDVVDPWVDLKFRSQDGNTALTISVRNKHTEVAYMLVQYGASITNEVFIQYQRQNALQIALQSGEEGLIQFFLDSDEFRTLEPEVKDAALVSAAMSGKCHVINMVMRYGVVVKNSGGLALLEAAKLGHFHLIETLVNMGASVSVSDASGNTVLKKAAQEGRLEAVQFLLKSGASPNGGSSCFNDSAILRAAINGHVDVVSLLDDVLRNNCSKFQMSSLRGEVLIAACAGNQSQLINIYLNDIETPVNYTDSTGQSALIVASRLGNLEVVKALLGRNCVINMPRYENQIGALAYAAANGHLHIVKILVEAGSNVNETSLVQHFETPLFAAIMNSHAGIAEFLISNGADLHFKLKMGRTILHKAVESALDLNTISLLIEWGSDINAKDFIGCTPLTLACRVAAVAQVKALVDAGADVNIKRNGGKSALDDLIHGSRMEIHNALRIEDRTDIIKYLLKTPDNICLTNELHSLTLLHAQWALPLVPYMIQGGALPTIQNSGSHYFIPDSIQATGTPFSVAICSEHFHLAKYYVLNWFLHEEDVYHFRHRSDVLEHFSRRRDPGTTSLLQNMFSRPWTLASLSFVVLSTALGMDQQRTSRVLSLNAPNAVKNKLLFRDISFDIMPIEQWSNFDLSAIHGSQSP